MKTYAAPKSLANFIIGELMRRINLGEVTMETLPFSASEFAKLVEMADTEKVSKNDAKKILRAMVETGEDAESIAKKQGMLIVNDLAKAKEQIAAILSANETAVVQYQNGEQKVFGFLMGQCTKALRGICTPKVIKETLETALKQPVAAKETVAEETAAKTETAPEEVAYTEYHNDAAYRPTVKDKILQVDGNTLLPEFDYEAARNHIPFLILTDTPPLIDRICHFCNASSKKRTASLTQSSQSRTTCPVSIPFSSLQITVPFCSINCCMIKRAS